MFFFPNQLFFDPEIMEPKSTMRIFIVGSTTNVGVQICVYHFENFLKWAPPRNHVGSSFQEAQGIMNCPSFINC